MNKIDEYLKSALVKESSDLHFISGDPPRVRVHGSLSTLSEEKLANDFVKECMYEIMGGTTQQDFESDDAADFVDAFRFANDKRKFQRFVTDTSLVPILEGDASASFEAVETDGSINR